MSAAYVLDAAGALLTAAGHLLQRAAARLAPPPDEDTPDAPVYAPVIQLRKRPLA